jgi:hypothetical protein
MRPSPAGSTWWPHCSPYCAPHRTGHADEQTAPRDDCRPDGPGPAGAGGLRHVAPDDGAAEDGAAEAGRHPLERRDERHAPGDDRALRAHQSFAVQHLVSAQPKAWTQTSAGDPRVIGRGASVAVSPCPTGRPGCGTPTDDVYTAKAAGRHDHRLVVRLRHAVLPVRQSGVRTRHQEHPGRRSLDARHTRRTSAPAEVCDDCRGAPGEVSGGIGAAGSAFSAPVCWLLTAGVNFPQATCRRPRGASLIWSDRVRRRATPRRIPWDSKTFPH